MKAIQKLNEDIEILKRKRLSELLAQCTPAQQEVFTMLFPEPIPAEKLDIAISLCDRTIDKNNKEKSHEAKV